MVVRAHMPGDLIGIAATWMSITLVMGLYLAGLQVLGHRAENPVARGAAWLGWHRVAAFGGGLVAVVVALQSPLDVVAEDLFVAHMAQHMVLVVVAAPLLAAGAPGIPLGVVLPRTARRRLLPFGRRALHAWPLRVTIHPATAWVLHVGALWVWHLPGPYEAALRSDPLHVLEHASFLGTAWLLWWQVMTRSRRRLAPPVGAVYLFAAMLPSAALGAVLTLAPNPLYREQAERSLAAGLAPLTDQQLAGLVMWIPADVVYLGAIVWLVLAWLSDPDRRSRPRHGTAAPPGPSP